MAGGRSQIAGAVRRVLPATRHLRSATCFLACVLALSAHAQQSKLKQIEVERKYWNAPASRGGGAIDAGKSVVDASTRIFHLGWNYEWGHGNHNRCDAMMKIDLAGDDVHVTVTADWDTQGFTTAREYFISAGSAFDRPQCKPNGMCHAVVESTIKGDDVKSSVLFGEDGGSIEVRLVYVQ